MTMKNIYYTIQYVHHNNDFDDTITIINDEFF